MAKEYRVVATLPRRSAPTVRARKTAAERGYNRHWQKARLQFIAAEFAEGRWSCAECGKPLVDTSDIHVDHKVPHRGDRAIFWDVSNWQLCHGACHAAKTLRGE